MLEMQNKLKPGRELDALIAEKVMGKPASVNSLYDPNDDDAYPDEWVLCEGGPLPFYSKEMNAVWDVVEHLAAKEIALQLWRAEKNEIGGPWFAIFTRDYWFGHPFKGEALLKIESAETAPQAICLAAIKQIQDKEKPQ